MAGVLEATLFTKNKDDLPSVETVLTTTLRNSFLVDMTVCDVQEYTELGVSVNADIEKVAAEKGVLLKEKTIGKWV